MYQNREGGNTEKREVNKILYESASQTNEVASLTRREHRKKGGEQNLV